MGLFDKELTKAQPGDKNYQGGQSSFRVYSKGCNKEVTVCRDSNGNVQAVFARDLFLGIF